MAPGQQPRYPPLSLGGVPARVHGVLYRLPRSDLPKLQQREQGYELQRMQVGKMTSCVISGKGLELGHAVISVASCWQGSRICPNAALSIFRRWRHMMAQW